MKTAPAKLLTGPAAIAAACILVGCLTTEQLAPPPGPSQIRYARDNGIEPEALARGRHVYLTDCARCHSPEAVTRYSAEQWAKILPRMSAESGLDGRDRADVEAYIHAILNTPPQAD